MFQSFSHKVKMDSVYLKLLHDQILQDIAASILEFKFNLMSNQENLGTLEMTQIDCPINWIAGG